MTAENTIVHRSGTYRTATPEQTWQRIAPLLPRFAITRVADITGLDEIGLPVHVAYRPVGGTIAVSIGTGLTAAQSRVSAVMESIEVWHAENPRLEVVDRCSADKLGLPYDVGTLNLAKRSLLTPRVVLDWVVGHGLLTGRPYPVPLETILLDFTDDTAWTRMLFQPSTNGLAAGNSLAEASLHGLLELAERDCVSGYLTGPAAGPRYVDPAAAEDPGTAAVYGALRRAACRIELCDITNGIGLPCFAARIWSADVPLTSGGFGCHVEPGIAVGRALAEAAQSRLAAVSGARDDIEVELYRDPDPLGRDVRGDGPFRPPARYPAPPGSGGVDAVLRHCAERVAEHTGAEPFAVDLSHPDLSRPDLGRVDLSRPDLGQAGAGIAVSKVFAPGLALYDQVALKSRRPADAR